MLKNFLNKFDNVNFTRKLEIKANHFNISGDNLILNLDNIDFIKENNFKVIFKNIKDRTLINCDYIVNNNDLIIDLSNIKLLSTDYEYTFYLLDSKDSYINIVYPNLIEYCINTIPVINNSNYKYKWFIRISKNGEFRISTISISTNYYKITP